MAHTQTTPRILSRQEASAVLNASSNSARGMELRMTRPSENWRAIKRRAMLELLYWCGLRAIEVVSIRDYEVEWPTPGNDLRCYLHLSRTKGNKPRTVPVPDIAVEWLQLWRERSEDWKRRTGSSSEYLFHDCLRGKGHQITKPQTTRALRYIVRNAAVDALGEAGADGVSIHTFRHTYCTDRLEDGAPLEAVAALAGHSSTRTTQIYTHLRPEYLSDLVKDAGKPKAGGKRKYQDSDDE